MQIAESFQSSSSRHFLMDEIYAPSLNPSDSSSASSKETEETNNHIKAINELHRFLESSCDCV